MPRKLFRELIRTAPIYSLGELAQAAAGIVLLPLYAWKLSKEEFGISALALLTITLLTQLSDTMIGTAMNRFYYNPAYKNRQRELVGGLWIVMMGMIALLLLVYFLTGRLIADWILQQPELLQLVWIYGGVLLLLPIVNMAQICLRLWQRPWLYITASLLRLLGNVGVTIVLLVGMDWGMFALAWGRVAGLALAGGVILPFVFLRARWRLDRALLREPLHFGAKLIVSGYSNLLIQTGDRYVILGFLDTAAVGVYDFAGKIASFLNIILLAPIRQAFSPVVLRHEEHPDHKTFVVRAGVYFLILAGLPFLVLAVFAQQWIHLLAMTNPEYWPAATVMPILAFSLVQHSFGQFPGQAIAMAKRPGIIASLNILAAVVNIGVNLSLVPFLGIMGAALGTLVSYVLWNVLRLYFASRCYEVRFPYLRLGWIVLWIFGLFAASLPLAENALWARGGIVLAYVLVAIVLLLTSEERLWIHTFLRQRIRKKNES